jgi:hypothetical protein
MRCLQATAALGEFKKPVYEYGVYETRPVDEFRKRRIHPYSVPYWRIQRAIGNHPKRRSYLEGCCTFAVHRVS